jgi:hypothetical protein
LRTVREKCDRELRALPPQVRALGGAASSPYPVSISETLQALAASIDALQDNSH